MKFPHVTKFPHAPDGLRFLHRVVNEANVGTIVGPEGRYELKFEIVLLIVSHHPSSTLPRVAQYVAPGPKRCRSSRETSSGKLKLPSLLQDQC